MKLRNALAVILCCTSLASAQRQVPTQEQLAEQEEMINNQLRALEMMYVAIEQKFGSEDLQKLEEQLQKQVQHYFNASITTRSPQSENKICAIICDIIEYFDNIDDKALTAEITLDSGNMAGVIAAAHIFNATSTLEITDEDQVQHFMDINMRLQQAIQRCCTV